MVTLTLAGPSYGVDIRTCALWGCIEVDGDGNAKTNSIPTVSIPKTGAVKRMVHLKKRFVIVFRGSYSHNFSYLTCFLTAKCMIQIMKDEQPLLPINFKLHKELVS